MDDTLAPPSNYHTNQREDVSALDRFNVHRCPTSGTGLEPVTKQATVRYLNHLATAAIKELLKKRRVRRQNINSLMTKMKHQI
ncbi:hypothetical protein TNCV_97281 [Trichonephila clavipes]|nr:hypothetical protein TNCV_97281 [Trichonephila clavipes]